MVASAGEKGQEMRGKLRLRHPFVVVYGGGRREAYYGALVPPGAGPALGPRDRRARAVARSVAPGPVGAQRAADRRHRGRARRARPAPDAEGHAAAATLAHG